MFRLLDRIGVIVLPILFLNASLGGTNGKAVDEILAEIADARRDIRTFTANFVQRKESDLFASAITSRGRLIMRPPDLLIWKIQEPLEALFFMYRGVVGTRDPYTGEVKQWRLDGNQGAHSSYQWLLGAIMGSLDDLKGSFRIEILEGDRERLLLRFVPREMDITAALTEIRLDFIPNGLYLREIIMKEQSGDRTEIRFEKIEVNGDIHREIPSWLQGDVER